MGKRALSRTVFEYRVSILVSQARRGLAIGSSVVILLFYETVFTFYVRFILFYQNGNIFLRIESSCFIIATIRANLDLILRNIQILRINLAYIIFV